MIDRKGIGCFVQMFAVGCLSCIVLSYNCVYASTSNVNNLSSEAPIVNRASLNQIIHSTKITGILSAAHVGTMDSNDWKNDQSYWNRAGNKLYLRASGGALTYVGQPNSISMDTSSLPLERNDPVKWYVNSPDCKLSLLPSNRTIVLLTATKPGIYTIQAQVHGEFSVPLVLTVNVPELKNSSFTIPQTVTGILPLPETVHRESQSTSEFRQISPSGTATPLAAIGDWIPISGSIRSHASSVAVFLTGFNDATQQQVQWDYLLPVDKDGTFKALVRSPFGGSTQVAIVPDYFKKANGNQDQSPIVTYSVNIRAKSLSAEQVALLANAHCDYNMNSEFFETASKLLENSPSLDTAIEAIDNYVSQSLTYNFAEFQEKVFYEQDAITTLREGSGMCMDFARVAMAEYQSIGIPAEVEVGELNSSIGEGPHVWLKAWDGHRWIPMDPSYTSIICTGSNRYFTKTVAMEGEYQLYSNLEPPMEWTGTALPPTFM